MADGQMVAVADGDRWGSLRRQMGKMGATDGEVSVDKWGAYFGRGATEREVYGDVWGAFVRQTVRRRQIGSVRTTFREHSDDRLGRCFGRFSGAGGGEPVAVGWGSGLLSDGGNGLVVRWLRQCGDKRGASSLRGNLLKNDK